MRGKVKFGPYLSSFFSIPNSEQYELLRAFDHFLTLGKTDGSWYRNAGNKLMQRYSQTFLTFRGFQLVNAQLITKCRKCSTKAHHHVSYASC